MKKFLKELPVAFTVLTPIWLPTVIILVVVAIGAAYDR